MLLVAPYFAFGWLSVAVWAVTILGLILGYAFRWKGVLAAFAFNLTAGYVWLKISASEVAERCARSPDPACSEGLAFAAFFCFVVIGLSAIGGICMIAMRAHLSRLGRFPRNATL